jgi:hypothetical protein
VTEAPELCEIQKCKYYLRKYMAKENFFIPAKVDILFINVDKKNEYNQCRYFPF